MLANEWAHAFRPLACRCRCGAARASQALELGAQVRRDVAKRRVTMDELKGRINRVLPSRFKRAVEGAALRPVCSAADADSIQLEALRGRLSEINNVKPFSSYDRLDAKCAVTQAIRSRVRQLAEKYPGRPALFGQTGDQSQDRPSWRAVTTRQ